jgi:predicted RNase H-like HicB family nuclease
MEPMPNAANVSLRHPRSRPRVVPESQAAEVYGILNTVEMVQGPRQFRGEGFVVRYRVVIEQDEDGVFVAEVPALPGCISQGKTRTEAVDNIKEAITGYLESLQAHGEPVPPSIAEEVVEIVL